MELVHCCFIIVNIIIVISLIALPLKNKVNSRKAKN